MGKVYMMLGRGGGGVTTLPHSNPPHHHSSTPTFQSNFWSMRDLLAFYFFCFQIISVGELCL